MKIRIQKVSGTVLYVMLAITLVILGMFFFGGETPVDQRLVADTAMEEPAQTDALIYWMYILFGIAVIITIVAAIYQFVTGFIDSPMTAIKSLLGLILIIVVLVISWAMGSDQPLVMPGYDGAENVPFWLKLTDMFLYTIYIMMGAMILLIFGFGIAKKFK
ncbi:hypothetical protein [Bacteroides gallinarum]|uniref:hypothetical protein n=1 Tax=Bacteroides gallinarum TaxID=376806 RepID=UPI00037DC736|nr:hypothetical protein [Bacteroides gallinarum]